MLNTVLLEKANYKAVHVVSLPKRISAIWDQCHLIKKKTKGFMCTFN